MIERQSLRQQLARLPPVAPGGVPGQVQAQFDAARMKAARPVQRRLAFEIVPLEAEAQFAKTSKQRTPARADRVPRRCFREGRTRPCGNHGAAAADSRHSADFASRLTAL